MLASFAAIINLYNIRQLILKYSIFLTKSKNPMVLRMTMIPMGMAFFIPLFYIWHIPSISI